MKTLPLSSLVGIIAVTLTGCNQAPTNVQKKAADVVVTTPIRGEVTDYQDFTGRLDAVLTVDVRPHVTGYVTQAEFKEGDHVKEGQLLFQIDIRQFQAALDQAEANLRQAEADFELQNRTRIRMEKLIRSKSISPEDYDVAVATYAKSHATVGAMRAARDQAKLNVEYTHVVAPISGRISRRVVDPGNLVNADNTVLTTIVSDKQLYAYFDVDERTYLDLLGSTSSENASWMANSQFPVLMRLANEEGFAHTGTVDFVDNRVNANTGTIRMRGLFDNPGVLKPGLFVRIRLPAGNPYQAIIIPDQAVLSDQGRKYVFVVNDQNEVMYRSVTLGQEIDGLRVIKTGLVGDERVVVSGMQRVRPGAKVEMKTQEPPKPPESPLSRLLTARPLPKPAKKKG